MHHLFVGGDIEDGVQLFECDLLCLPEKEKNY